MSLKLTDVLKPIINVPVKNSEGNVVELPIVTNTEYLWDKDIKKNQEEINRYVLQENNKYKSSIEDTSATTDGIGGIPADTTVENLNGKNYSEILDDLIFPATNPTFEKPSIDGFELATSDIVVEVGNGVIPVSPARFNYGKWIEYNNIDGSDLEYAGHPYEISYLFVINGVPVSLRNLLPQHNMPTLPSTYTVAGNNIYRADIHYYKGQVPVNNRKEEVPEIACPGGSVSKTNIVNASYSYEATLCQNELDSSPALNSYLEKCSIVGNKGYIEMLRIKDGYIMEKKDPYVYPIFKVYGKLKELNVYDSMAKENEEGVRVSSLLPRLQAIEEKINDIKTGYTIYQYPEDLEIGKQKIYNGIIEFNI